MVLVAELAQVPDLIVIVCSILSFVLMVIGSLGLAILVEVFA